MKHRLANLDLLRGIASLLVCSQHLRHFLFVDFHELEHHNLLHRLFYFLGALGHQSVVVFFVLSGFLVGGSVLESHQSGRWSWKLYAARRVSRLWAVLLPALLFTFICDSVGRHFMPAAYHGSFHEIYHLSFTVPLDLRWQTLLGNAFFLQTIYSNCFGTNSPLWSLAYEFWFYVLLPLVCSIWFVRSWAGRLACVALLSLIVWWLPLYFSVGWAIFLLGTGAFLLGRSERARTLFRRNDWLVFTGVLAFCSLAISTRKPTWGTDCAVGIAFALLVTSLAWRGNPVAWLTKTAVGLSEISYSLYLFHFPFMAFVVFCFFGGHKLQPTPVNWLLFSGLLTGTVLFGSGMWWCFERNTPRLRRWMESFTMSQSHPW